MFFGVRTPYFQPQQTDFLSVVFVSMFYKKHFGLGANVLYKLLKKSVLLCQDQGGRWIHGGLLILLIQASNIKPLHVKVIKTVFKLNASVRGLYFLPPTTFLLMVLCYTILYSFTHFSIHLQKA